VVGVRHDLMRTAGKPLHAALQVIKAHSEVTRVTPSRLQPHPYGKKIPYLQQTQRSKRTKGACWASSSTVAPRTAKTEIP
jgi:hypothetical protein